MSRITRVMAATVASLALLASCAPSSSAPPPGEEAAPPTTTTAATKDAAQEAAGSDECTEPTTLRVWSWRTEDITHYNKIFDVFTEQNPCIEVDFQAFVNTEYNQILQTGLTGSDGPDVAQVRTYGLLQPLVEGGNLIPLDDIVPEALEIDESIISGAKGRADGKLYGVPFASQTLQMYYNIDIFAEHGLEVPTTWDEFMNVLDTLQAADVTPMAVGGKDAWMMPIVHEVLGNARYGGASFEADVLSGAKNFSDPDYVASLQVLKDMQPYMPADVVGVGYAESQVLFASGLAAMFPGGSFELAFFTGENPDLNLGVFQVPPPPGSVLDHPTSQSWADGNFGVSSNSAHPEESAKLIQFIASTEFGQMVADELKQFSPIPGVQFHDPVMADMWDLYSANPAPYLMLVNFRYGTPSGTDLIGEGVQELFLGDKTPEQIGTQIDTGLSEWFEPSS